MWIYAEPYFMSHLLIPMILGKLLVHGKDLGLFSFDDFCKKWASSF